MSALSTAILPVPLALPLELPLEVVVELDGEHVELFVHVLHRLLDMPSVKVELGPGKEAIVDVIPDRGLIFPERRQGLPRKISESREKNPNNEVKKLVGRQRSLR